MTQIKFIPYNGTSCRIEQPRFTTFDVTSDESRAKAIAWAESLQLPEDETSKLTGMISRLNEDELRKLNPKAPRQVERRYYELDELLQLNLEPEWLINGVMVRQQPMLIAGPPKILKTSVMLDMAVALATGGHWLGYFGVMERCRVLVLSAESYLGVIQDTIRRILAAARIDFVDGIKLAVSSWVPKAERQLDLKALAEDIERHEAEIVFVDPAYFAMPADESANVIANGEALQQLNTACHDAGATLVLLHHSRKAKGSDFTPMELHEMAGAGYQEFAAQWVLISRLTPFDRETGTNRLSLNIGGRAGQCGLWGLTVVEGVRTDQQDERTWQAKIEPIGEQIDELAKERAKSKFVAKQQEAQIRIQEAKEAILKAMNSLSVGTKTEIADAAGWSRNATAFQSAFGELIRLGEMEKTEITRGNNRTYDGYRRTYKTSEIA